MSSDLSYPLPPRRSCRLHLRHSDVCVLNSVLKTKLFTAGINQKKNFIMTLNWDIKGMEVSKNVFKNEKPQLQRNDLHKHF